MKLWKKTAFLIIPLVVAFGATCVSADVTLPDYLEQLRQANPELDFSWYADYGAGSEDSSETGARTSSSSATAFTTPTTSATSSLGADVMSIQQMLSQLGYYSGSVDGDYGAVTMDAVRRFQQEQGLYVDGDAGSLTVAALRESTGGSQASSGTPNASAASGSAGFADNSVSGIQQMLTKLGYYYGAVDGDYGALTKAAVRRFQEAHGLYVDGDAGPITIAALRKQTSGASSPGSSSAQSTAIDPEDNSVSAIQKMLAKLGYYSGAVDGDYGPVTMDAVRRYQAANGLYADGDAGPITIASLRQKTGTAPSVQSQPGSASTVEGIVAGGTYVITNGAQKAVLDVAGRSVDDGANVMLDSANGAYNQEWVLQSAGNGYYYLRNLHSWKVLELENGNVTQGDADGSNSQMWKLVKKGDGFQIVNSNGMYLDTASGNVNGAGSNDAATQTWFLQEVDPGTAIDFRRDGIQTIGIRTFQVNQGNVTETSDFYNLQTDIDLPSGGYWLSSGSNYSIGLKVMYVTRYLVNAGYLNGSYYNYNRYDDTTAAAVAQFQRDHGLYVDGIVGEQTWNAMGYSSDDFYNLGAYTTDLKVPAYGSDRSAYIDAMVNTAREYAESGTSYSDGASGRPGTYVDCSGLIFQCLYAAGINPSVNIIDHARVVYEYTSRNLGNDARMGIAVGSAERGDLVFYGNSNGINHVGIYAGNGMIYDSTPGNGVKYRNIYAGGNILRIVRVF